MDIWNMAGRIKVFAAEMAGHVADRCVQVHGAYGLEENRPLAKIRKQGCHLRLGVGSVEMIRCVLALPFLRD